VEGKGEDKNGDHENFITVTQESNTTSLVLRNEQERRFGMH
jgi:hypothetical protein